MKIGIEVEGKYKGLKSVFIDLNELRFLDESKIPEGYHHLYISVPLDYDVFEYNDDIKKVLKKYDVTLEVDSIDDIDEEILKNVHIMLRIYHPDVWLLKNTDSIKFHSENNDVLSSSIETMYRTNPKDFEKDVYV